MQGRDRLLQHLPDELRRHRPLRGLVHHLQLLLDPRRPAGQGDGVDAGHRRQPPPGARVGPDGGDRRRGSRPRSSASRPASAWPACSKALLDADRARDPRRQRRRQHRRTVVVSIGRRRRCASPRRSSRLVRPRRCRRSRPCVDVAVDVVRRSRGRTVTGTVITGLGAASMGAGLFGGAGAAVGRPRRGGWCSSVSPCSVRCWPAR